jgi:4-amino-4-deoxy-L-arabinose transferase-like glycosyltransferase
MHWYPLTTKEALLLLLVFVVSGIFSHFQQYFVSPSLLPFTYILFLLLLLLAFFPVARPADPHALARFLSVLLGVIYAAMIVIREFVIRQNYSWHSVVVIAGVIICPLIAGWCYHLIVKKK